MKPHRRPFHALALGFLAAVGPSSTARAQTVAAQPQPVLDATARQQIVDRFAEAMRNRYVFPERGEKVAAKILSASQAGAYDAARSPGQLAQRLSADASEETHDKHLMVFAVGAPPVGEPGRSMPAAEAGVVRADMLPNGAGYLEIVAFPPLPTFKPVIDRVMSSLSGRRVLIIDVRRNGGGDPHSVAYLVSFLIPPDRPVNDMLFRVEKTREMKRESFRSVPTPVSLRNVRVYVLTSQATFSGGEEFAYDMQAMKRATLIGQTTGGGANPAGPVDLGHGIVAVVPGGRPENPYTKTNWEGVGVRPDVAVPADEALSVALTRIGLKPVADISAVSARRTFNPRTAQLPGSDTALRDLVTRIANGTAAEGKLDPRFASMVKPHLPALRAQLEVLGDLQAVEFWRPAPAGGDEYKLTFAKGRRKMIIDLGKDGVITGFAPPIPLGPEE